MHTYFYKRKKSCLATQALRQKWRYCYFLGYYRPSLKALSFFLYLSEEIFLYIIWKIDRNKFERSMTNPSSFFGGREGGSASLKPLSLFWYLSEEFFFISSESLYIWLHFKKWLEIIFCPLPFFLLFFLLFFSFFSFFSFFNHEGGEK